MQQYSPAAFQTGSEWDSCHSCINLSALGFCYSDWWSVRDCFWGKKRYVSTEPLLHRSSPCSAVGLVMCGECRGRGRRSCHWRQFWRAHECKEPWGCRNASKETVAEAYLSPNCHWCESRVASKEISYLGIIRLLEYQMSFLVLNRYL